MVQELLKEICREEEEEMEMVEGSALVSVGLIKVFAPIDHGLQFNISVTTSPESE